MKGRDCIYLDQVKQDALNNLTFTGDINGHLISHVEELYKSFQSNAPVSYTHLDVYKRQEKLRIIRSHMDSLHLCKLNLESLILATAEKYLTQLNLVMTCLLYTSRCV